MDKYTVDLDQVLNDFEFSELTDQQTTNGIEYNKNHILQTKSTPIVKHSINNVFHSLNEYLNTDSEQADNVANIIEDNLANLIEEIDTQLPTEEISEENLIESTIDQDSTDHMAEEIDDQEQMTNDLSMSTVNNENDNNIVMEFDEKLDEIIENKVIGFDDSTDFDDNQLVKYLEELEDDFNTKTIDCNLNTSNNIQIDSELEESEVKNEQEMTDVKSEVINIPDMTVEKSEVKTDLELKDTKNETNLVETKEISDSNLEILEKSEVKSMEIPENLDEEKIIEKLENEDKSDVEEVEDEDVEDEEEFESTTEIPITNDIKLATDNIRPNELSLAAPKREIDLIGGPGSTPYNNVYIDKDLKAVTAAGAGPHESDTDASVTSASPTFSDVSTETLSSSVDEGGGDKIPPPAAPTTNEETTGLDVATNSTNPIETPPTDTTQLTDWLGKQAPLWIPDNETANCLHCDMKFTVLKRRHHCRACGLVLCAKCCSMRIYLDYMEAEARVCNRCHNLLANNRSDDDDNAGGGGDGIDQSHRPDPNNPADYCSTVPPHEQEAGSEARPPPVILVPVLKRSGSTNRKDGRGTKSVMFCDGIRPGSDLTNLDHDFGYKSTNTNADKPKKGRVNAKGINDITKCLMPEDSNALPPTVISTKSGLIYEDCHNDMEIVKILRDNNLTFALQTNLLVHLKIIELSCCVGKTVWCFTSEGLINVGQDEIVILLELMDNEQIVPRDIFLHINDIYLDAVKGNSVKELGISLHRTGIFLDSKNHAGFIYIRPTFQCLQSIKIPEEPYLIAILIHRWETPWAKLFPLRLILRLGAEYRYYPTPLTSHRHRDSVFVEIGHTIINLLADFRNFSYTLPQIRGLTVHMEDKKTTVTIPKNRYDQIMKTLENSSDHILAFAASFSLDADSHLVCIQDTQSRENSYTTHAINIHNRPRKITGASFIVFNGALKSSSGLTAKSSIVEDGLMIQVTAEHLMRLREHLKQMKDHITSCGCINAITDETVNIIWGESDIGFNLNVKSPIDDLPMNGISSIRVHNGKDFIGGAGNRLIRWTEVFIIKNGEDELNHYHNQDPIDLSKISEQIAIAVCNALVRYIDLLANNQFFKIAIRTTLDLDNVSYLAGSNSIRLPPIYMKSLDNELISILHRQMADLSINGQTIVLELIFRILNV